MVAFPLSPVLSACDSLDGIEDLDAFLESQGGLSHWPTPPAPATKDDSTITEAEIASTDEEDFNGVHCGTMHYRQDVTRPDRYIAELFTQEASIELAADPLDIGLVEDILVRARLSPEVLALAFNILRGINKRPIRPGYFDGSLPDLLVACALRLASCSTDDHPPSLLYWSRDICDGTWTVRRIDKSCLQMLGFLDWRLHEFYSPSALEQGMAELFDISFKKPPNSVDRTPDSQMKETHAQPLKLVIEGTSAAWVNGQLTPEGTPPCTLVEFCGTSFLPLL